MAVIKIQRSDRQVAQFKATPLGAAALPALVPYNNKPDDTNLSYASKAFATSG